MFNGGVFFPQDVAEYCNTTTIERGESMNKAKLRGKIFECGFNIDSFCRVAGFARSTFDRKMDPDTNVPFTRDEIERIIEILNLSDDEIRLIFFPNLVAENSNN